MKTFKPLVFSLLALAVSAAQAGSLLPAGTADQRPARLVAAPLPAGDFERQPVAMAWPMDPRAELAAPAPHVAESREFWATVEADELRSGFNLDTSAPGALVRLSPVGAASGQRAAMAVDPSQLRVLRDGRLLSQPASLRQRATTEQLRAAGMDVSDGTVVVQLEPALGKGRFQLQLPRAEGRYLVHVYEPTSDVVLRAQADRQRVLAGQAFEVSAELRQGIVGMRGASIEGQLVSPDGRSFPLAFRGGKARAQLPEDAGNGPGLWEVQLFAGAASAGGPVQRDARTAIEVARPTARLAGGYAFDAAAVGFRLPVQVAAAGRYELRGVLYATSPAGRLVPVAQAHSAAWLEPGQRNLSLPFGPGNLPMGYGAPFELRQLELKDQTRMGTLETRSVALREGKARVRTPGRGLVR